MQVGWPCHGKHGRQSNLAAPGNQVTPFTLNTPDGESVYAWHITPLPLYLKNEARLTGQPQGLSPDFAKTQSFRLLKEDPEARLILYCKSRRL